MSLNSNYQLKEIELKIDKSKPPATFVVYNSRIYRNEPSTISVTRVLASLAYPFAFLLWLSLLLITVSALLVQPVNASLLINAVPRQIDSGSSSTSQATTSPAYQACRSYADIELIYDQGLYVELNMHDTLVNLYRSCYKEKFDENLKSSLFKSGLLGPCSSGKRAGGLKSGSTSGASNSSSTRAFTTTFLPSTSGKSGRYSFSATPPANDILMELWMDKEYSIIPSHIRNRIDLVCRSNSFDSKLFNLFIFK